MPTTVFDSGQGSGVRCLTLPFDFSAASFISTTALTANTRVVGVDIQITTPFSVGATLQAQKVGGAPVLAASPADVIPQTTGLYSVPQNTSWGVGDAAVEMVVGGAPAAGVGELLVFYVPTPAV